VKLTSSDLEQINQKGISEPDLNDQLRIFSSGVKPAELTRACKIGDGILRLSAAEVEGYSGSFNKKSQDLNVLKFVPASGAASRMFKHLHQFDAQNPDSLCQEFIDRFSSLPFANEVEEMSSSKSAQERIDLTMTQDGLGYAHVPKGMVQFHSYAQGAKTAFEEHLTEGVQFASGNEVNIHFTVPEGQEANIQQFLLKKASENHVEQFNLSFSTQKSFTDTVAVTLDDQPFRLDDSSLLFRPGGHGALIHNLNENPADLIFIKNIDNVVHESRIEETTLWKKVLGGKLIEVRSKVHGFLRACSDGSASLEQEAELRSLLGLEDLERDALISALHAPIRVCGMVKNEGEPGGGPFWLNENRFPQVVESAQISDDENQQSIVTTATHFNPTDLVCCTIDHRGEAYDLLDFVDRDAGFISEKSVEGTAVKALELPGLWNGSMARWISVFIEVPVSTFNPVKTVNDLLRPMHQPQ
jgi:hypothetical protein